MTGKELKRIRNIAGFTAKEFGQSINKSTSFAYSLEKFGNSHIAPRWEEAFIAFLGPSLYGKSRRIYELELEHEAQMMLKADEAKRIYEENSLKWEAEAENKRKEQLEEKKRQREFDLDEQLETMEAKKERELQKEHSPAPDEPGTENDSAETLPDEPQPDQVANGDAAFDAKLDQFMDLLEKSRVKPPVEEMESPEASPDSPLHSDNETTEDK